MLSWKQVGVQFVGVFLYISGLGLLLLMVLSIYLATPEQSFANLSMLHIPMLLLSLLLIIAGRIIGWRYSDSAGMNSVPTGLMTFSHYHQFSMPDDKNQQSVDRYERPLPTKTEEDGIIYVYCAECRSKNENGYTFCGNCSAKLPT